MKRTETVFFDGETKTRREAQILRALDNPHPDSEYWAELGFDDWAAQLPEEDISELVEAGDGTEVRWVPGQGWCEA